MVAHKVSGGADGTRYVGALADEPSNEKKGGAHLVLGEHVQQLLGVGIVRAVVVGKGKFIRIGASNDGTAKDLRGGPHRRVGVPSGSENGCGADTGGSGG
jgi:hypothetical protein